MISRKTFKGNKEEHSLCSKLDSLHEKILECRLCCNEFGFEPRPIVQGNENAKVMQISQAPSKTVHKTGRPFNDASGVKLKREWYQISDSMFYDPNNFYIASMAHCFPGKIPGGGDRKPPRRCSELWLSKEMELVNNGIYIIIGSYASNFFFPREKITSLVFQDREIHGRPAYVLPHPSPLNVKWFMDNPEFIEERMPKIRRTIHKILNLY